MPLIECEINQNAGCLQILDARSLQERRSVQPQARELKLTGTDACRFQHPSNRNQPNNRDSNRYGPLDNDKPNQGGRGGYNQRRDAEPPYSLDAETIRTDLSKEPPQWILSCYGPGRNAPAHLFGGPSREQSFEEMRIRHYELASQGKAQEAVDEAQKMVGVAQEQMRVALQDVRGAIEFICNAENDHPNRIDICKAGSSQSTSGGSGFSTTSFTQGVGKPAGAAFGQPSQLTGSSGPLANAQASSSVAFGQPSQPSAGGGAFGRPSAPSTGAFGQPSNPTTGGLGQPSASLTGGFGQPSAPTTGGFGQTSGQSLGAFGRPAAPSTGGFGQSAAPSTGGFGQSAASSTGGFGQSSAPSIAAFGQPSVPSTGAFGQPSRTSTGAFGQPSAPSTGAFGQPSAPSTGAFGQPSAPSGGAFGQPSAAAGGFGQPSAFGQPSTQSSGGFGQPSVPATGGFGQQSSSPFAKSSQQNSTNPFAKPQTTLGQNSQPPQAASGSRTGPKRDGSGRLIAWDGKPVSYPDGNTEPCFRRPDGQRERIWFPDGEPARTMPQEIPLDRYDENLEQEYQYLKENDDFRDGVIPQFPPKWEWTAWDF